MAEMGAPEGHQGFGFPFSAFLFFAHVLYPEGYLTVLDVGWNFNSHSQVPGRNSEARRYWNPNAFPWVCCLHTLAQRSA